MAYRRVPLAPGEWYHCYSRGVDKRRVFSAVKDYERFLQALYLSNDTGATNRPNFQHLCHEAIFELPRNKQLVAVGAYCLMPNHFHLLLKEVEEGGISKFMHKLGTSYTMYFNIKNERVGNLFVKPFRSKHVGEDRYFKHVAQYIHLNPAEIYEPRWRAGIVHSFSELETHLEAYRFSSFLDYCGSGRKERTILDTDAVNLIRDAILPLKSVLAETAAYYADLGEF